MLKTIQWTADPDGEYNEETAEVNGHKVTIYSDRDGEKWSASIDGDEFTDLEAGDRYSARREAISEAMAL